MSNEWEPSFEGWQEDKVELSDSSVETHSSSKGEYGVLVQHPGRPYSSAGAIFWTDPQHLYFRYDWGLWFPVSTDDPENCTTICKRRTATMLLCTMTTMKHYPIKVYHIDSLPEELFGKDLSAPPSEESKAPVEPEPTSDETDPDNQDFVSAVMCIADGNLIANSDSLPLPVVIYECKGHCICFTFFSETGDWLADEELCDGDQWPYWFGESSMRTSPSAIASAVREKIRPIIPEGVPLDSVVMLGGACSIINESEYASSWQDRNVTVVRRDELEGSGLPALTDFLNALKGASRPELVKFGEKIGEALDDLPKQLLDV